MKRGALLLIFLLIIPASYGFLEKITGKAVCPASDEPVCGIDGNTYSNTCIAGDVRVSHKGACGDSELVILYKNPDTGILSFLHSVDIKSKPELFRLGYMETKGDNFKVTAGGLNGGILAMKIDMVSDDGTLPKGKDYINVYWNISGQNVNSLGSFYGGNKTDTDMEMPVGEDGRLVALNTVNYSMRARYGVVIEQPQAYAARNRVSMKVPSDIVKAAIKIGGRDKNNSKIFTLGLGESVKGSYSHKDFPSIKDSTVSYNNKTYHISEFIVINDAPVLQIGSISKDFRFGDDMYFALESGKMVYRYFFVDPFDWGAFNISKGLQLEILGQKMAYKTFSRGSRSHDCFAGSLMGVIYENGDVYPCEMLKGYKSGNLRDSGYDLNKIWASAAADAARKWIKLKKCHCTYECQYTCNILYNIRFLPLLARGILTHKLFARRTILW